MKDALKEFCFAIPISVENETFLEDLGYDRRTGSCTYTHKYFVVVPFKKWYYPVDYHYGIKLDTTEVIHVTTKLEIEYPNK